MQVGIGIKCGFEFLRVDLPILVKDMRIHACDHVDLRVSRIALCGFQVAVVKFQLVSRTWNVGESGKPLSAVLRPLGALQTL